MDKKEYIVIVSIFILVMVMGIFFINPSYEKDDLIQEDLFYLSTVQLDFLSQEIITFLSSLENEVVFFSRISSLENNLDSLEFNDLENDFVNLMGDNVFYYQIRFISDDGIERVRVNYDNGKIARVPKKDLQDKSQREYFIETMKLEKDELYISPLELNIEKGEIENRGSFENPKYVPIIRYSTPVFDKENKKRGIIVFNIYADYFLNNIQNFQKSLNLHLINQDGYYLVGNNKSKTYGFMFNNNETFFNDYGLPENFFELGIEDNKFEINGEEYVVNFIFPDFLSKKAYSAKERLGYERYWILISKIKD